MRLKTWLDYFSFCATLRPGGRDPEDCDSVEVNFQVEQGQINWCFTESITCRLALLPISQYNAQKKASGDRVRPGGEVAFFLSFLLLLVCCSFVCLLLPVVVVYNNRRGSTLDLHEMTPAV